MRRSYAPTSFLDRTASATRLDSMLTPQTQRRVVIALAVVLGLALALSLVAPAFSG
jgi:hypothetical protein